MAGKSKVQNPKELLLSKYALKNFDVEKICQLAVNSEMKYITFTTIHLSRCYNFETGTSDFDSLNEACGRDLAKELADACQKYGLALFFYVWLEYAQTWDEEQIKHKFLGTRNEKENPHFKHSAVRSLPCWLQ